ncbi:MAG: epoxyqueuosine reductase [Tissierellia bacterium]|nr:epoxyqueuosine reductase [Tissierellia bacterium]
MRVKIESIIEDYVKEYESTEGIRSEWKVPLVAFADAMDPMFNRLKEVVAPTHAMPRDFMSDGRTIITYFLPFQDFIPDSNIGGRKASEVWAIAYVETNELIARLNKHIKQRIEELGHGAELIPMALSYAPDNLKSDWSQRHVAYIAGLGKFGLNNMLITEKGCCGRVGSIITNLKIEPTKRDEDEYCLYKAGINCTKCIDNCINDALRDDGFVRERCYEMCRENGERYKYLGHSEVCGKCLVGIPCSFENPVIKSKVRL